MTRRDATIKGDAGEVLSSSTVLAALRAVAAEMPQPFDPVHEVTATQAMEILGTQDRKVVERELSTRGWTKRSARLPNGRTGDAWRMPGNSGH